MISIARIGAIRCLDPDLLLDVDDAPNGLAAEALGISRATAYREWAYARSWLAIALEASA
jgi:hypothetical protein